MTYLFYRHFEPTAEQNQSPYFLNNFLRNPFLFDFFLYQIQRSAKPHKRSRIFDDVLLYTYFHNFGTNKIIVGAGIINDRNFRVFLF